MGVESTSFASFITFLLKTTIKCYNVFCCRRSPLPSPIIPDPPLEPATGCHMLVLPAHLLDFDQEEDLM
jgi:hypothetical protein